MADTQQTANGIAKPDQTMEESRLSDRAAFLAEMEKPAEKPKAEAPAADDGDTDGDDNAKADESSDDEVTKDEIEPAKPDPDDEESDEEKPAEAKLDRDTERRMEAIRNREKHARAQIAKERADFEAERSGYAEEFKALKEFRDLKAKARSRPVAIMRALGVSDDMFEEFSKAFYAESAAGQKDPKWRESSKRALEHREQADEIAELRKRLDERDQAEKKRAEQELVQREVARYVDGVAKAASPKSYPLAAHFLGKHPEKTRTRLTEIARHLAEGASEIPDPRDVLAAYEKARADELRELGIDPATLAKPGTAAEAKPGKDKAKPTKDKPGDKPKTPTKADIVRELEAGDFD